MVDFANEFLGKSGSEQDLGATPQIKIVTIGVGGAETTQ